MKTDERAARDRATDAALKAKRIVVEAVRQRVEQDEGFKRAQAAAQSAIEGGATFERAVVVAGDELFAFITETCGVEGDTRATQQRGDG